jgi:hypothetical protein
MKFLNGKILSSAAAMLVLTGCAASGMKILDAGLTSLVGQPIQTAYNRLGYPNGTQTMNGDTFYIWSTNRNVVMPVNQTGSAYGSVGTTPFQVNSTVPQMVPMNFNCTIRVITGSDNVVKSWDYQGNAGGCQGYVRSLKQQGFK